MRDHDFDGCGFETRAVRTGQSRTPELEHNDPIFTTSSFVFGDAREAAARFSEQEPGNVYSRFTNPTVRSFERRLASLEQGRFCIATASGMSAILTTCLALLGAGAHVVAARSLFGATLSLFGNILTRFGVETTCVPLTDADAWAAALRPQTRMLFVESPSNPLMEIADIEALAALAHAHDCILVVDNCMCTPVILQPLTMGADVVIHSGTKYLDGQGRCVGGAVVTSNERFASDIFGILRTAGPCMSPFNAWVFLKGLETLGIRMRAHGERALALARRLEDHPAVTRVYYPGLAGHPGAALAKKFRNGYGGVLAFEVAGGREEAWGVIDSTRIFSITANFGDAKSTITHPASTTHGRLSAEQRAAAGVGENLLRISVGLEEVEDLEADLCRGLDAVAAAAPPAASA